MILAFKIIATVFAALMMFILTGAMLKLETKEDRRTLSLVFITFGLCIIAIWL